MINYKARNGDTLSAITKTYYGNASATPQLAQHNAIDDPDRINIGQVIKIPKWLAQRETVQKKGQSSIVKLKTFKCRVGEEDVCAVQFGPDQSPWPQVCDPYLENGVDNVIAIFTADKVTTCTMVAEIIDNAGVVIKEVNVENQAQNTYRIRWDVTDKKNKRVPFGAYKARFSATKNKCVVSDAESTDVKVIRVGVTEMKFLDAVSIKFYKDYKSGLKWKRHDFDIPGTQWKLKKLDDAKGTGPIEEPDVSIEKPGSDNDHYNYPVCYVKDSKIRSQIKIAGENFDAADKIRVLIRETALFDGANNENITIGSEPAMTASDTNKLNDSIEMLENYCMDLKFQYKAQDGSWKEIGAQKSSKHTFFIIVDNPVEPWGDGSAPEKVRPWVHVLKLLCSDWVKGLNSKKAAAEQLVEKVFHSGFKYDTDRGDSKYTTGQQNEYAEFRKWINKIAGINKHNGAKVNCTDCGTMVTCCANMVGCELFSSSFFKLVLDKGQWKPVTFFCHKIMCIGFTTWDYPFSQDYGGNKGGFSYHEIGWEGNCDKTDNIFDPCLKAAQDPVAHPATNDIYAKDMDYNTYEPKLVVSADVAETIPLPQTKERRIVR